MIKQIKRVAAIVLVELMGISAVAPSTFVDYRVIEAEAPATITSDVVENKSVIEKQEQTQIEEISEQEQKEENKKVEIKKKKKHYKVGYTIATVNVRKKPSKKSAIKTTLDFNSKIKYRKLNKKWVEIKYKKGVAYVAKKYVSKKKCKYKQYIIPNNSGFKSFMGYKAITSRSSKQYLLQSNYATTGNYGIRIVNNRYCVAIGSYFHTKIGQYFDLVLKNGIIIPCIMGDEKANKDTDGANIFSRNGCCSEFLVDTTNLKKSIKISGNVSSATKKWNSPVKYVRAYKKNILKK